MEERHHIDCGPVKEFTAVLDTNLLDRTPIAVSLGPILEGVCRPKADNCDGYSQLAGASKRVCRQPFGRRKHVARRFAAFVKKWLKDNVTPIDWTLDVNLEDYLAESHYSEARKQQLRNASFERDPATFDLAYRQAKCFIKDESYGEFKAPRWIMSRCEAFKAEFGPYIHFAEKEIYKMKYFVKHLTPEQRISRLCEMDQFGATFWTTDHSSFEAAMTVETMCICEIALLDHLYGKHPQYETLRKNIDSVVGRKNHLVCSHAVIDGIEARMSGDNHTSLGNGFTNLMAISFALHEIGVAEFDALIEGDDAVFSSYGKKVEKKDFNRIGFDVKMLEGPVAPEQGFCGLIADHITKEAITEPYKVLLNFGWTSKQYLFSSDDTMKALVRAKALSYGFMYPSCPVLSAFFKRMLLLTSDVTHYKMLRVIKNAKMDLYQRQKMLRAIHSKIVFSEPTARTRQLFSHVFAISIDEQKEMETILGGCSLGPIKLPPHLLVGVGDACYTTWDEFVVTEPHAYGHAPLQDLRDVRELYWTFRMPKKLRMRG